MVTERINDIERMLRGPWRPRGRNDAPSRGMVIRRDGVLIEGDIVAGAIEGGESR